MRANEPYVDNAIWVVDPHHDAILVAGDIEYRAAVFEDAGGANVAFDVRRCGPVGRFDLPVPRHHGIARFGVRRAPIEETLKRSERDDPHIAAIAWSQLGTKTIAARVTA
jgi:hypothetical protein